MSLEKLDPETRALLALAGAIATGEEPRVAVCCEECVARGVSALWVDELLLQSVLLVGWPRALSALAVWRRIGPAAALQEEDGTDYSRAAVWRARGEAVCREVYGENYARLRDNVRALHPALDAWMVIEGYGKTLGRPGLDLARRELCVAMQVAIQGAERQLHAHLKGALNAGASHAAVAEALELTRPLLGAREGELAGMLWERVRQ
ncbi:MAG TPA: carboxymuconolactone decarboxylase family protein [Gemmatimonadales bacterium]|jgi:4-carboxymuconolactone decarboxylase|nr:carboxymuconolactone decarboxylase family protein [Gemmatimonadales bacterium]